MIFLGIPLPSLMLVFTFALSSNNSFSGNTVSDNSYGLYLEESFTNRINENRIQDNTGYGIYVSYSGNTRIYHNNFINNTQHTYDECTNIWDNGYPSGGNYFDDYIGKDVNGDGIGDTSYKIKGGDNVDWHPLMHRFVLGDMNVDSIVDFDDINPFVMALRNQTRYMKEFRIHPVIHGDINQDAKFDFDDINLFVALLRGN